MSWSEDMNGERVQRSRPTSWHLHVAVTTQCRQMTVRHGASGHEVQGHRADVYVMVACAHLPDSVVKTIYGLPPSPRGRRRVSIPTPRSFQTLSSELWQNSLQRPLNIISTSPSSSTTWAERRAHAGTLASSELDTQVADACFRAQ